MPTKLSILGSSTALTKYYYMTAWEITMLLRDLREASYPGNIGAMEVMKFYQQASDVERSQLDAFLNQKNYEEAWELIQQVTNTRLHPMSGE